MKVDLRTMLFFRVEVSPSPFHWHGNQDISFGDFFGLAFVAALITSALCLTILIIFDVLN